MSLAKPAGHAAPSWQRHRLARLVQPDHPPRKGSHAEHGNAIRGSPTLLATLATWLLVACSSQVPPSITDRAQSALAHVQRHPQRAVCSSNAPGQKRCHMHIRLTDDGLKPYATGSPSGYGPPDLISAYNLSTAPSASGVTVALVDAYDDPSAESDLAVYRSQYNLPPCTSANGCFKKIAQDGSSNLPPQDTTGWATEMSLDLDMVSAICPSCNILLVEANSDSGDDLYIAENAAAAAGAAAISNSWGGDEDDTITGLDASYFNHPGILITASAGDNGTGASYPATSPYVLAVGGTSLVQGGGARGWSETAWSDSGSGCSAYEAEPSYQDGLFDSSVCGNRLEADVSAVADPNTGVATYCTWGGASSGCTGWIQVGGTSASSPIVASMFTRLGGAAAAAQPAGWPYANTAAFYDVTSGSNGTCGNLICTAGAGYDGPTGWGTPNALAIVSALNGSGAGGGSGGGAGGSSGGGAGGSSGGGAGGSSGGGAGGGSGGGAGGSSGGGAGGGSGATCDHGICSMGDALDPTCDPCAAEICAQDSYCCDSAWDTTCVGEVQSISRPDLRRLRWRQRRRRGRRQRWRLGRRQRRWLGRRQRRTLHAQRVHPRRPAGARLRRLLLDRLRARHLLLRHPLGSHLRVRGRDRVRHLPIADTRPLQP